MLYARLTDDNNWVVVSGDNEFELQQLRAEFTKKYNDWFIIKKKAPQATVEEVFMNSYGMIPVGLWIEVVNVCRKYGFNIQFADDFDGRIRDINISREGFENYAKNLFRNNTRFQPRGYQIDGAFNALSYKRCCIEVSTSGGKTFMAYVMFRYMKDVLHINHILFITPKTDLTTQSADKFIEYDQANGILTDWTYGEIHANAKKKETYDENIVFGNYQSLAKKNEDFFAKFDAVFIDECHHGVCTSIRTITRKCTNASYKIGMTGTFPKDGTYDSFVLQSHIGPVVYRLPSYVLINEEHAATPVYVRSVVLNYLSESDRRDLYDLRRSKDKTDPTAGSRILDVEKRIVRDNPVRFRYITDMLSKTTKNSLVIFSDVQNNYGRRIFDWIKENTEKSVYYIEGDTNPATREQIKQRMEDDLNGNTIIVASMGCFSEGIDMCNLWNIFIVESTKSDNIIAQILGRGMRRFAGKERTIVIDFVDDFRYGNDYYKENYLYRHGIDRMQIYRQRGFPCDVFNVNVNVE